MNNLENIELNPDDPDFYIEEFWCSFKISLFNFYSNIKKSCSHIEVWSKNLNNLKSQKKYNDIENTIREYMSKYAFDLIKFNDSIYINDIFITNIKRWNKLSSKFNFKNSIDYSKILTIFLIYNEIKKHGDKYNHVINQYIIESILKYNLFDHIIKFAVNNSKTKILELLKKVENYDLIYNIKRLYPKTEFSPNIKMNKLCILLKKSISL